MRILLWALRAVLFLFLFAFALNNQHEAVLRGFFGTEWRTPMVVVVLSSFAAGAVLALVALMPRVWRSGLQKPVTPPVASATQPEAQAASPGRTRATAGVPADSRPMALDHPPRDGI